MEVIDLQCDTDLRHVYVDKFDLNFSKSVCLLIGLQCFYFSCGGVRLSPLGTSVTIWPILPASDDRR
jgi:hypothetical protein